LAFAEVEAISASRGVELQGSKATPSDSSTFIYITPHGESFINHHHPTQSVFYTHLPSGSYTRFLAEVMDVPCSTLQHEYRAVNTVGTCARLDSHDATGRFGQHKTKHSCLKMIPEDSVLGHFFLTVAQFASTAPTMFFGTHL